VGIFYPKDEGKLSFYSQVFDTVEIDSTFYTYPAKGLAYAWSRSTKQGFIFSAKIPEFITHEKKLSLKEGVEEDLLRFTDLMKPLQDAGKLGPLLIQLPPGFKKNYELLKEFFQILPLGYKFACEFRHPSWWVNETWSLLKEFNIACVVVDEPLLPPDPVVTADFSFIRWHGRGKRPWYNYRYSIDELKPWVDKVKQISVKNLTIAQTSTKSLK